MQRNFLRYTMFLIFYSPYVLSLAITPPSSFKLIDRVCIVIEGQDPIYLSQIQTRAKTKGISFVDAQKELEREKRMWAYAKKQLKYNTADIFKQADEHIKKIRENNKLSEEDFLKALQTHYHVSLKEYRHEVATAILENVMKSAIASQITISETEINEEVKRLIREAEVLNLVIIKIADEKKPTFVDKRSNNKSLSDQIIKANKIRSEINSNTSLKEIRKRYEGGRDISIGEPIVYKKGDKIKGYEDKIASLEPGMVSPPFVDGNAVTLIWMIRKRSKETVDEGALIEKAKKTLYDAAVEKQFNTVRTPMMDSSTAIINRCKDDS